MVIRTLRNRITGRELEVLKLLANGLTMKQISKKLYIGKTTVITHVENLKKKCRVKNCKELIYRATKARII